MDNHPYSKVESRDKGKSLLAEKHYNMASVEKILETPNLPDLDLLSDKQAALDWWQGKAGNIRGKFEIQSKDGLSITLDNNFRKHVLEQNQDNRWKYIHKATEIIENPDEIWCSKEKSELNMVYIKYYKNTPIIVEIDPSQGLRAYTMFSEIKDGKLNSQGIQGKRRGQLIFKK